MKTLLFVDDDVRVLQGLQRQLRGMRDQWAMHFVDGGVKALELLATTTVDVIVTDMMMPVMDGAQLLTEVMKLHPHTVRLVLSGHADREAVLRLVGPAHQYLSKPCDGEELRNAINRAFALRELLTSEPLKQLVTRVRCLPSLPSLHAQLTRELQQEDPDLDVVGRIISQDIGMMTKILQLVNSAFFGLAQPISNPAEAVAYLGLNTVRSLALSLQVFSQFEQFKVKGFSVESLASHGWTAGMFARRIAAMEHCEQRKMDQCFLAGMLHDVGRLILASEMPEAYARALEVARGEKRAVWAAEQDEFGATHAQIGAYLLGLWGLPNHIIEAVAYHHQPAACPTRVFSPVIAVHVANAFAHEQTDTGGSLPGNELDLTTLASLGLDGRIEAWRERCFSE